MMKRSVLLIFGLLCTVFVFGQNLRSGETVDINEKTNENLYLVGGDININKTIAGDLVASGGEIHLRDSLLDDVILAGGSLNVDAYCGDDLRMVAGEVKISEDILGDLVLMAGEARIDEGVTIHGSVIGAVGELKIYGKVLGDVKLRAGDVRVGGEVLGQLNIIAGEIDIDALIKGQSTLAAMEINLSHEAAFQSDVNYWTKAGTIDFSDHLQSGSTANFDTGLKNEFMDVNWEKTFRDGKVAFNGFRLVSGLFLTLLIFLFGRPYFQRNAGTFLSEPAPVLVKGLVTLIGLPIFSAFAFATVIGIPVGLIASSLFVIALLSSNALASVIGAFEINKLQEKDWSKGRLLLLSLALFAGIRLLSFIPIMGGIISFVVGAVAIGYIVQTIRRKPKGGLPTNEPTEDLV
ncbi:MAG: hypothetical protein AAF242_12575 [Bacteroidota bacterium]